MDTQDISQEFTTVHKGTVSNFSANDKVPLLENSVNTIHTSLQTYAKLQVIRYLNFADTINGFSNLQANWDSYQADKISKKAIETAIETLDDMRNNGILQSKMVINVFPMRDGGIQFEFDGDTICAELEINQYGKLTFILYDDDGNLIESSQILDPSELSTRL